LVREAPFLTPPRTRGKGEFDVRVVVVQEGKEEEEVRRMNE
jgi:hypothetical protein